MDIEAIQKLCKEYEQKNGEGSIFQVGSKKSALDIPRWSTGIEDLDAILGGGMPYGRVIEIFGPESAGKTSLAFHLASMVKLANYYPIEGTYDEARALALGVKKKQMIVTRCDYGEQAINSIIRFAKAGIPLQILDSVPACQPKDDMESIEKDAEKETRIGGVARLFSKTMPTIVRTHEKSGSTLILVNQVRDKMNAMLFGEKDDTPGGRAIKFYASVRLKVARRAWIEIPNKNPRSSAANEKVGIIMKIRCVKSKVCNPYGECEIPMFFDRGFVSFDDLKEIRKELMSERRGK